MMMEEIGGATIAWPRGNGGLSSMRTRKESTNERLLVFDGLSSSGRSYRIESAADVVFANLILGRNG